MPLLSLEACWRHPVCGLSLHVYMIIYWKFVNTMSCKPLAEISPNLQLWCSWGQRWACLDFEIKQSMSQQDYKWSNKHFARHFLDSTMHGHLCLWNMCYLWPRARDISKVMGSEVKVTDIYQKCTFLVLAYRSTVYTYICSFCVRFMLFVFLH